MSGFDQFDNEADVGKWTGILGPLGFLASILRLSDCMPSVSTFFLTQFLTSLLWVRRVLACVYLVEGVLTLLRRRQ